MIGKSKKSVQTTLQFIFFLLILGQVRVFLRSNDDPWIRLLGVSLRLPCFHQFIDEGDSTGSLKGSEDLVYASQEWLSAKYIDDAQQWGVFDPERWDAFYGWLYENELTAHDLRTVGYTNDYLK
jgi:hypothetical protein